MRKLIRSVVATLALALTPAAPLLAEALISFVQTATPTPEPLIPIEPSPSPVPVTTIIPLGPEFIATPTAAPIPTLIPGPRTPKIDPRKKRALCSALKRQLKQYQSELAQIRREISSINALITGLLKIKSPEAAKEAAGRIIAGLLERWAKLSEERDWIRGAIEDIHANEAVLHC